MEIKPLCITLPDNFFQMGVPIEDCDIIGYIKETQTENDIVMCIESILYGEPVMICMESDKDKYKITKKEQV